MKRAQDDLPSDVVRVLDHFVKTKDPRLGLLQKLTSSRECAKMWRSLFRGHYSRIKDNNKKLPIIVSDRWIYEFLSVVETAQRQRASYVDLSGAEARAAGEAVRSLAKKLACLSKELQISIPVLGARGDIQVIDSRFFERYGDTAYEMLTSSSLRVRQGDTSKEVRFALILSMYMQQVCGKPFDSVVATVTNAVFHTNYGPSDIAHLRLRRRNRRAGHAGGT